MGGSEDNALRRDSPTAGCEVLMPTTGGWAGLAALEGVASPVCSRLWPGSFLAMSLYLLKCG